MRRQRFSKSAYTVAVVSDMQIPYHDAKAVSNVIRFVRDFKPDMLVNVGDDLDSPEVAHWSKGGAMEYAGTFQDGLDEVRIIHADFRNALGDRPYHLSRSNHGDRTRKYIRQYAPALDSLRTLHLEELAGYNALGIKYHDRPFEIAPGWICAHGDEGTTSKISGRTAGLLAERWGTSLVCGHSHRAGISSKTYGFNGTIGRQVTGMEVGHLMDVGRADYMKGGHADWQQAFGLLYVANGHVTPVLVPVHAGGRFTVEGESYA